MAFAFVESNTITTYPVTSSDIRARFPNVSFPSNLNTLTTEQLSEFGLVSVLSETMPSFDVNTQTVSEGTPTLNAGVWRQNWTVSSLPTETIALNLSKRQDIARAQRGQLLQSCDWVVTMHKELGTTIPAAWKTYRQALRDVPAQEGFPDNITWPTEPS